MPLIPKVTEAQTRAFSNAWDSGGIKVIMDATSIRFATDWANIALQSFVAQIAQDMAKKVAAKKAEQAAQGTTPTNVVSTQTVPTAAPTAGRITLTD